MSMLDQVKDMNTAFGNPEGRLSLYGEPGPEADAAWSKLGKQCTNIFSEYGELLAAIDHACLDDTRDAVCDILVFTLGAFHFMGATPERLSAGLPDGILPYPSGEKDAHWAGWSAVRTDAGSVHAAYTELMQAIDQRCLNDVQRRLNDLVSECLILYARLQLDVERDMTSVVSAVMTRFCRDEAELCATEEKYDALGVDYYIEGEFPRVCLKSRYDQPGPNGDFLPKGKFLKSVGMSLPVFYRPDVV